MNQSVPTNCLDMCSYDVDFSSLGYSTLLSCVSYIPMMLMCGAGKLSLDHMIIIQSRDQ